MARSRLLLLGGFELAGEAAQEAALTRKARGVLAYLALQSGRGQSREKLATLFWGSNGEAQARTNLRQALTAIRRALPAAERERFLTRGDTVALNLDDLEVDAARFEKLAGGAAQDGEQAIALYRGDLLDGFSLKEEPFEEWLRAERERLRAIAVAALERLIAHYTAEEAHGSALTAATRLLALEPLREDVHRTLMRIYAAQGRVNLALKQFELCREALAKELGVQPEAETVALYDALRTRRHKANGAASPKAERPQTHYVKSAGCSIAYQISGAGPVDLVYVPGWVSNLDYAWESPRFAHVLQRLGSFARLIRFDKRGTGLSDRSMGLPSLEQRMEDARAVLDSVGSTRTVLFGSSEGGNLCMLFAAAYPERTAALVLNGAYAKGLWAEDYPWAKTRVQMEDELQRIERRWGEPFELHNASPTLKDDAFECEWFAAYTRNSASPADALALWRWSSELDMRDVLPRIQVPTLILQSRGDRWVKVEEGRYLAEHIAGARYCELPGDDHVIWGDDADRRVDEIHAFVAGLARG